MIKVKMTVMMALEQQKVVIISERVQSMNETPLGYKHNNTYKGDIAQYD